MKSPSYKSHLITIKSPLLVGITSEITLKSAWIPAPFFLEHGPQAFEEVCDASAVQTRGAWLVGGLIWFNDD